MYFLNPGCMVWVLHRDRRLYVYIMYPVYLGVTTEVFIEDYFRYMPILKLLLLVGGYLALSPGKGLLVKDSGYCWV